MCRQRAGCNAGTLTARSLVEAAARDVQARAWWQLPRGNWSVWRASGVLRVLRVWRVWSLANSRLECPNKRGQCGWRWEGLVAAAARELEGFRGFKGLKPGKRQAWMPWQEMAVCRQRAGCNAGTLTARSLVEAAARDVQAKGRLQRWSSKGWRWEGLVAAAARELEGLRGFKGFRGFEGLKPGKRQAWMP